MERRHPVDAELGQLLHGELRTLALGHCERDGDRRFECGHVEDLTRRFEAPACAEDAVAPRAETVGGGDCRPDSKPQHPLEVVAVVSIERRLGDVSDEGVGRRPCSGWRGRGGLVVSYLNALLIRERSPLSTGATSSPRRAAS